MKSKKVTKKENAAVTTLPESSMHVFNISLSEIVPNPYNPRKYFDELKMQELTDSIKAQGILQPILLRRLKDKKYEIVYGERRYRAAQRNEFTTIPATVRDIPDDEAKELALTENLQRQDVTDMEEANAFSMLLETSRYDVKRLTEKFGKSETYIRNRLSLLNLCDEFALLLNKKEIIFSVALELSHYSKEDQQEIFKEHFANDISPYQKWNDIKFTDFVSRLERAYSCCLNDYGFDKTECLNCPFNSACQNLFAEEETAPVCKNRMCLKNKNTVYIVNTVMSYLQQENTLKLSKPFYRTNNEAIIRLEEYGLEVTECNVNEYPVCPEVPKREDYETEADFTEAETEYKEAFAEYTEETEKINDQYVNGEISRYLIIGEKSVSLGYMTIKQEKIIAGYEESNPKETAIEKLKKQDERNLEIKQENTINEAKTFVKEKEIPQKKAFSEQEEKIFYFLLIPFISNKTLKSLGFQDEKFYMTYEDKLCLVNKLTDKDKNRIKRDFIVKQLESAHRDNAEAKLLIEFLQIHFPDDYATIEQKYTAVYEKRHKRITEKLNAFESENTDYEEVTEQTGEERYLPAVIVCTNENVKALNEVVNSNVEFLTGDDIFLNFENVKNRGQVIEIETIETENVIWETNCVS